MTTIRAISKDAQFLPIHSHSLSMNYQVLLLMAIIITNASGFPSIVPGWLLAKKVKREVSPNLNSFYRLTTPASVAIIDSDLWNLFNNNKGFFHGLQAVAFPGPSSTKSEIELQTSRRSLLEDLPVPTSSMTFQSSQTGINIQTPQVHDPAQVPKLTKLAHQEAPTKTWALGATGLNGNQANQPNAMYDIFIVGLEKDILSQLGFDSYSALVNFISSKLLEKPSKQLKSNNTAKFNQTAKRLQAPPTKQPQLNPKKNITLTGFFGDKKDMDDLFSYETNFTGKEVDMLSSAVHSTVSSSAQEGNNSKKNHAIQLQANPNGTRPQPTPQPTHNKNTTKEKPPANQLQVNSNDTQPQPKPEPAPAPPPPPSPPQPPSPPALLANNSQANNTTLPKPSPPLPPAKPPKVTYVLQNGDKLVSLEDLQMLGNVLSDSKSSFTTKAPGMFLIKPDPAFEKQILTILSKGSPSGQELWDLINKGGFGRTVT